VSPDNGDRIDYGYGLIFDQYHGACTVSHGGLRGGFSSEFIRCPEHVLTIVILVNPADLDPQDLARRMAGLYLEESLARLSPSEQAVRRDWEVDSRQTAATPSDVTHGTPASHSHLAADSARRPGGPRCPPEQGPALSAG
jgi:hypothetical protein